jgi:hypothetical protein
VSFSTDGQVDAFEIQFVDATSNSIYGSIPVRFMSGPDRDGSHLVQIQPGTALADLDFGNAPIGGGSIHGRKWLDRNGNGQLDGDERGLGGVMIYLDLDDSGQADWHEPQTVTAFDDPVTDFDEAGLYSFTGLAEGTYAVREILPPNYVQTSPGPDARVLDSQTGSMNTGIALDLDVTDVSAEWEGEDAAGGLIANLQMTVIWPDSCGTLRPDVTAFTVVGQSIVVELAGHQVGSECADVISPQHATLDVPGLQPGVYQVVGVLHESLPGGATDLPTLTVVGQIDIGGAGARHVLLAKDQSVDGIDFGNRSTLRPGSIHGLKWLDSNGDGKRDVEEPGLPGVTIYVDANWNGQLDPGEPMAVSMVDDLLTDVDEAGQYWIVDVEPGQYVVREVVPDGYHQTFPPRGFVGWLPQPAEPVVGPDGTVVVDPVWPLPFDQAHLVFVESGGTVEQIDFGNQPTRPGSIQGAKWLDRNGNGQREDTEGGLAGVTIYVDLNYNGQLDDGEPATQTGEDDPATDVDETGQYELAGLDPGFYAVREVVPPGFLQTFPPTWLPWVMDGNDPTRPDFLPPFPWPGEGAHWVDLPSGGVVEHIDFGNLVAREPASIHGIKWADHDGDGQHDADEPGLADVVIFADYNLNGQLDQDEPLTQTMRDDPATEVNETGRYWLSVLAGERLILEGTPGGYEQTYPDPHRRVRYPFNLGHVVLAESGAVVEGIDFGNKPVPHDSAVHGIKWLDLNGDGQRDGDEPGLSGVVIFADLNQNGVVDFDEPATRTMEDDATTPFDETGEYWLSGLAAGSHQIREVLPPGMAQTFPATGGHVVDVVSEDLAPGRALVFELTGVTTDSTVDNLFGTILTFHVVWPDGCGQLLPDAAQAQFDGQHIQVDVYGTQVGEACTEALKSETVSVRIRDPQPGTYSISATLWESSSPVLPAFEQSFLLNGIINIGVGDGAHHIVLEPGQSITDANFGNRHIDLPPPDPTTADVNHDGHLGVEDIDMLAAAIRSGQAEATQYDLSGNGHVDEFDLKFLVEDVLHVRYGDANFDGLFDSSDLVLVFQSGKYENQQPDSATWAEGDWNGDGQFDTSDLVLGFQSGYEQTSASQTAIGPSAADAALAVLVPSLNTRRNR